MTTSALYVQDLALWLPLLAVATWWMYRGRPRGFVIVAVMLGMWVIESVSVAVDQWFAHQADPTSAVASDAAVLPFLAAAVIGVIPVVLLLRGYDEPRPDRRGLPSGQPGRAARATST